MEINNLEVYKLSRELSKIGWNIYNKLEWQDKKIMGDQFIEAVDSVGANIAEGYRRFHYLDRNKFNYNSRGSLIESLHWLNVLSERNKINKEECNKFLDIAKTLTVKLNNYIKTTKNFAAK